MRHLLVKHAICAVILVYLTEIVLDLDLPFFVLLLGMWVVMFGVELAYGRVFPRADDFPV